MTARDPAVRPSLQDLAGGVLSLVVTLRSTGAYGEEPDLRNRLHRYLDALEQQGLQYGYTQGDLREVRFPLVAFIDEVILLSDWEHRERWRDRPLQLDLFGERTAGQRFFTRLTELRQAGETRRDILEIYHLCLTLGFAGSYRVSGLDRLQQEIDALRRDLGYLPLDTREVRLSPGGLPDGAGRGPVSDMGASRFWTRWGVAAAAVVVLYLGYWFWVNAAAGGAVAPPGA
jgi:type IV/VI secretion system ImpK/VasF family protein